MLLKFQRAHIPKTIINVLEKNPADSDEDILGEAKKAEDERLAEQESLYQVSNNYQETSEEHHK